MIKQISVIETFCRKLDEVLPSRHEIRFNPGLTLLVGENGSGKTAFLRLIYSSMLNELYFTAYGYSRFFNLFNFNSLHLTELPHDVIDKYKGYGLLFSYRPSNLEEKLEEKIKHHVLKMCGLESSIGDLLFERVVKRCTFFLN